MALLLPRLPGVRFALVVFILALTLAPGRGHAQGAAAHPHERAQAPIPTPLRQVFRSCRIWQYAGPDSTGKTLQFRQRFNARGLLVKDVEYKRHRGRLAVFTSERSYYRRGRLTKQIQWRMPGKGRADWKLRTRFHYNRQGQLVREECVRFRHLIKRGLVRGRGSGGPDLIALDDLERRRRPDQRTETRYAYSPLGHKVDRQFLVDQTDHSRDTWAYDSLGRIIRHAYFDGGKLRGVEHHHYWPLAEGSRCDRTWSDTDAAPGPVAVPQPGETPPHTVTTYFDRQQRQVRQVSKQAPGQAAEVIRMTYDAQGRLHLVQTLAVTGGPGTSMVYSYP